MRIDILTLFPEMIKPFIEGSIIKRATLKGKVSINLVDIRDFTTLSGNQVDDTPYGGGAGMVIMCDPVFKAVESVRTEDAVVILTSPAGNVFNQEKAKEFVNFKHLIILCGHYEGFDERIKSLVDMEISIGDFVLTGGEVPALAIVDSVVRLIDGVISKDSLESESFNDNLLDYPVYTKPRVYNGMEVPEVLVSGDHKKIDEYRMNERIRITKEKRPDLLK